MSIGYAESERSDEIHQSLNFSLQQKKEKQYIRFRPVNLSYQISPQLMPIESVREERPNKVYLPPVKSRNFKYFRPSSKVNSKSVLQSSKKRLNPLIFPKQNSPSISYRTAVQKHSKLMSAQINKSLNKSPLNQQSYSLLQEEPENSYRNNLINRFNQHKFQVASLESQKNFEAFIKVSENNFKTKLRQERAKRKEQQRESLLKVYQKREEAKEQRADKKIRIKKQLQRERSEILEFMNNKLHLVQRLVANYQKQGGNIDDVLKDPHELDALIDKRSIYL